MTSSNSRIFLAIILSLLLFFGIKYLYTNPQILSPDNIYASITQKTAELKIKISSIKIPNLKKLFILNFDYQTNSDTDESIHQNQTSFSLPTVIQPTLTQNSVCTGQACLTPTTKLFPTTKPLLTRRPTAVPRPPTAIPRPTAVPTPAPKPITSDTRPGTSLREIFEEVNKRMCIPVALLMAFQTAETGAWFKINEPASIIKIYNTYGWWKTSAADPCKGFGYDESTGYVPADSYYANKFCMFTPGANPGQMGIFSINQWEQDTSRKNTISTLPNNIDRRVLFDDAIIFASITKNRVGNLAPDSCDDWPDDVIRLAAEKHLGSCGHNYCDDVLKYYKQYR